MLRLCPERDLRGLAVAPAVATLVAGPAPEGPAPESKARIVPVDPSWVGRRRPGDVVGLVDTRGSRREWRVTETAPGGAVVEAWDTTYVETGTVLSCHGDSTAVGPLAPVAQYHVLCAGDLLVLTRDQQPAAPWRHGRP